jgi:uncharacterized membrane protein
MITFPITWTRLSLVSIQNVQRFVWFLLKCVYQARTVSGLVYLCQGYVSVFIRLHFRTVPVLWYIMCVSFYYFQRTPYINHLFSQARILITNSFLYKYVLKETDLCTFCIETKESLVHVIGNAGTVLKCNRMNTETYPWHRYTRPLTVLAWYTHLSKNQLV